MGGQVFVITGVCLCLQVWVDRYMFMIPGVCDCRCMYIGKGSIFVFAGVGGQVDFIRGAALGSDGLGKPILAMPSTTRHGESKIVKFIKEGTCASKMKQV